MPDFDSTSEQYKQIYAMLDDLAEGAHRAFHDPDMYKGWIEEYTAKLNQILLKERIEELSDLISNMNAGDEFLSKPTVKNKGWNKVIIKRISQLQSQLREGNENE